jgi:hypothetical protein
MPPACRRCKARAGQKGVHGVWKHVEVDHPRRRGITAPGSSYPPKDKEERA